MVLGGLRRCAVLGLRLTDRFFASVAAYLDRERPPDAVSDRLFVVLKGPRDT